MVAAGVQAGARERAHGGVAVGEHVAVHDDVEGHRAGGEGAQLVETGDLAADEHVFWQWRREVLLERLDGLTPLELWMPCNRMDRLLEM